MILGANVDVLTSLRKYYEGLLRNKDFPLKKHCREDILKFAAQIDNMIYDLNMQISRAKLLVRIAADRKSLVRFRFSFFPLLFSSKGISLDFLTST